MKLTPGSKGLIRTTEPVLPAVSVAYINNWSVISNDATFITNATAAATSIAEKHCGRAFITQVWKMTLDRWPGGEADWWDVWHAVRREGRVAWVELDYPRLQTVDSINTYDIDDVATSITVNDYFFVDINNEPGRLALRTGQDWPQDTRNVHRMEITYTTGYGLTDADVPAGIHMALAQMVTWMDNHRGDCDAGPVLSNSGAGASLAPFVIMDVEA